MSRGPAAEWYDALQPFLLLGPTVRLWFAENVFLKNRDRFSEYLLECPSAEASQRHSPRELTAPLSAQVRNMFSKMITFLCVATNKDPPIEVSVTTNAGTGEFYSASRRILHSCFLQRKPATCSVRLPSTVYCSCSRSKWQITRDISTNISRSSSTTPTEECPRLAKVTVYPSVHVHTLPPSLSQRKQLLHLSVPSLFIAVALDEGPGPPLRSPYADLSKLYAVVGILVRSCDVTMMQKSLYEVRFPE